MRLATILEDGRPVAGLVRGDRALDDRVLALTAAGPGLATAREIAAGGAEALARISAWADRRPDRDWRPLGAVNLGPAVPDPGAVYTIGLNYRLPGSGAGQDDGPERPLVYGKAASSVVGHGATLAWDRGVTDNVDAEVELGVVIGAPGFAIAPADAMRHVFGYTVINDVSSRDPALDGDQWLLGKSMPGFCPVGPWVVTADEVDPGGLRLGCTIDGQPIQDDTTARLRFPVAEIVAFLSRHALLRPGDLIATGTPARLATPPGPGRRLGPGDTVTTWIERIGELTVTIA